MEQEKVKDIIVETFNEMGVYIDVSVGVPHSSLYTPEELPSVDVDLREYVDDSIMFISLVVELEKKFEIEFPDELLLIDKMVSLSGFANLLMEIINSGKEECNEKGIEEATP